MKATFHGDRLLTVEGTPQEISLFKDLQEWGPKVKPSGVPFKPLMPHYTVGDPPGSVGSSKYTLTPYGGSVVGAYDF